MPTLTYYKNVRNDGGVRTGVGLNGETVLEDFVEGRQEPDPILVWYVDLLFESSKVPKEAEAIRAWLATMGNYVKQGLDEIATKMEVGIDQQWNPFSYPLLRTPTGVKITMSGAAMNRVRIEDFAQHLREIKQEWDKSLRRLKSPIPSSW